MKVRRELPHPSPPHAGARGRKSNQRLTAIGAAVAAAVALWALIEEVAGVDLRAPAFEGSARGFDIGLGAVVITSALASLGAWALLGLLERWIRRPARVWAGTALLGFLVSLSGPMSGTGISSGERFLLAMLHLVVAGVLIPLMYRTADA